MAYRASVQMFRLVVSGRFWVVYVVVVPLSSTWLRLTSTCAWLFLLVPVNQMSIEWLRVCVCVSMRMEFDTSQQSTVWLTTDLQYIYFYFDMHDSHTRQPAPTINAQNHTLQTNRTEYKLTVEFRGCHYYYLKFDRGACIRARMQRLQIAMSTVELMLAQDRHATEREE